MASIVGQLIAMVSRERGATSPDVMQRASENRIRLQATGLIAGVSRIDAAAARFCRHRLRIRAGMNWFRVSRGRLEFRGRITRDRFNRWTTTEEGAAAVGRVAEGLGFSLFGRNRAARRSLWRELDQATRPSSVVEAIADEASRYMQTVARLAYSDGLPRAHIALHRLVLVPRALIAGHARAALCKRLAEIPELAGLDEAVRIFLFDQLVIEMDAALQKGELSVRNPAQAQDEWACVGVSKGVVWVDPLWAGPDGTGHLFMYEFPRVGLSRKDRKALETAIADMSTSVALLTNLQRNAMIRTASAR